MSKLFKLKEWLTVPDAAKHLSVLFGEEVNEADVLRLALDGHLILSINFLNFTYARLGYIVSSYQEVKNKKSTNGIRGYFPFLDSNKNNFHSEKLFFIYSDRPGSIKGLWDLPMIGGEKRNVEYEYQTLIGGPEVKNYFFDICLIKDLQGQIYSLLACDGDNRSIEDSEFYEATKFPSDSVLVVRTTALREFEQLGAKSDNKNIQSFKESTRKTENLLSAFTAIAIDAYGYDPRSLKSNAPQDIANAMSNHRVSFDAKTIRNWLKEGAALLPSKREED